MARGDRQLEHVLRRIGFGASSAELASFAGRSIAEVIDTLLNYEQFPDDVDTNIGKPEYVAVTTRGQFAPDTVINDARQRELFRMIHSKRQLQEKMALFWHNHFATAYSKVNGTYGSVHATKLMAGRQGVIAGNQRGQYELFRQMATGNFAELIFEVAKDPAMLVWLDGRNNTRQRPQENFGREVMELFTMGVGNYTEADVVAAARVFTGWTLVLSGDRAAAETAYYQFTFNANNHDPGAKEFTFAVGPGGSKTIPARAASEGMQDGQDLIMALVSNPATAHRLAAKLYAVLRQRDAAPGGSCRQRPGEHVHAEQLQHQGDAAALVHVRVFPQRRVRAATRGRSSSSLDRSRKPDGTGCRLTPR